MIWKEVRKRDRENVYVWGERERERERERGGKREQGIKKKNKIKKVAEDPHLRLYLMGLLTIIVIIITAIIT